VPEPVIANVGARIMALDDPTIKMSKSMAHIKGHSVPLLADPKEIEKIIMRAKTDSGSEIRFSKDAEKAGVNNLLSIYQVLTKKSRDEVEQDFANARGYGDLKKAVAQVIIAETEPIRARHKTLMADRGEILRIAAAGAEKARALSTPRLQDVKQKMGLLAKS